MSLDETTIAHRGGAGLAPENTLRAFEMSAALGVRVLETDVRVTQDGIPVAFHDARLTRTLGLPGRFSDYNWSTLADSRLGGEPLVPLEDLLALFPDASFLVDLKDARRIQPVIDVLRRARCADRVRVSGSWDRTLTAVSGATGVTRALGWRGLSALMWGARLGVAPPTSMLRGASAAHLPVRLSGLDWMADAPLRTRLLEMAHTAGLQVCVWTVNDPLEMHAHRAAGVDAIITDRPDLLREVLISRGEWRGFIPASVSDQGRRAARERSSATRTNPRLSTASS